MPKTPALKRVMTPFPYSIQIDAPIADARRLMEEHRIRHLPVKDGDQLTGILTDRDIKLVLGPYMDIPSIHPVLVRHACLTEIFTAEIDTPLDLVVEEMARRRVGSVIVTKDARLAGIFTSVDLCRVTAALLRGTPDEISGGDAA